MEYHLIEFENRENVGTITLKRPEVLNSFNKEMASETQHALDKCSADKEIRAVLITGEGRAFCAGQDLEEAIAPESKIAEIVKNTYNPIIIKIRTIEKPVVCAVNGVAAGAGANIAFACDLTLAGKSASFIQSFIHIGLIPDSGGTYTLPRLVGMQRAAALTMLGEKIKAEEAQNLGLIYKVCEDETLLEEAFSLASKLAKMPTRGIGLTKRGMNHGLSTDLQSQLDFEVTIQEEAGNTADYKEGVNAFLEKRKANFKGE